MYMEKSCNNCKYYRQYYVKRLVSFAALDKGHCVCPDKISEVSGLCGYWVDNAEREELRKAVIKKSLEDTSQRLYDIVTVLKSE